MRLLEDTEAGHRADLEAEEEAEAGTLVEDTTINTISMGGCKVALLVCLCHVIMVGTSNCPFGFWMRCIYQHSESFKRTFHPNHRSN